MNKKLFLILVVLVLLTVFVADAKKKKKTEKTHKSSAKFHHNYLRTSSCNSVCTSQYGNMGYTNCGLASQSCCPGANCSGAWYKGYTCSGGALNVTC